MLLRMIVAEWDDPNRPDALNESFVRAIVAHLVGSIVVSHMLFPSRDAVYSRHCDGSGDRPSSSPSSLVSLGPLQLPEPPTQ